MAAAVRPPSPGLRRASKVEPFGLHLARDTFGPGAGVVDAGGDERVCVLDGGALGRGDGQAAVRPARGGGDAVPAGGDPDGTAAAGGGDGGDDGADGARDQGAVRADG